MKTLIKLVLAMLVIITLCIFFIGFLFYKFLPTPPFKFNSDQMQFNHISHIRTLGDYKSDGSLRISEGISEIQAVKFTNEQGNHLYIFDGNTILQGSLILDENTKVDLDGCTDSSGEGLEGFGSWSEQVCNDHFLYFYAKDGEGITFVLEGGKDEMYKILKEYDEK